jgi:hypothetical protein
LQTLFANNLPDKIIGWKNTCCYVYFSVRASSGSASVLPTAGNAEQNGDKN